MKRLVQIAILLTVSHFAQSQTANEVIAKHIEAIGGMEKLQKLKTVVMEGSMNVMGNEMVIKIFQENDKGMRQNISLSGMEGYSIITPAEGWSYMPFMGQTEPQAMPKEELVQAIDDLDLEGSLVNYLEKGHTVSYEGKEDVGGTLCHKLKVVRKSSGENILFIDAATNYIIRTLKRGETMGQQVEMATDFSDYRDVEGYKMPFSITQQFGMVNFSSIKVNVKLPANIFSKG